MFAINENQSMTMKCVLIADCTKDSIVFNCPMDIGLHNLSEMRSIFNSFKFNCQEKTYDQGRVSSRDGIFYYYLFPSKLFIVISTTSDYKDIKAKEFATKLNDEIWMNDFIELNSEDDSNMNNTNRKSVELKREGKEFVFKMFEVYKHLNTNGDIKEINFENIDVSSYFIHNTVQDTEKSLIPIDDENGIEITEDGEILNEQRLFRKDINELQKVTWWRTMKLIFIVICFLFAIVLYLSIPIIVKYQRYFNSKTNGTNETSGISNNTTALLYLR